MVTGYSGTYRALVVDDADPLQQYRLGVVVPDVYGDVSVWAVASLTAAPGSPLPTIGDSVWVSFEHGDSDYPIWEADAAGSYDSGSSHRGYTGKYRAAVVDNNDPMQQRRLEVTVPDVDPAPAWAMASDEVQYLDPPEAGTEVWVEYDNGDPAYPRWVGLI